MLLDLILMKISVVTNVSFTTDFVSYFAEHAGFSTFPFTDALAAKPSCLRRQYFYYYFSNQSSKYLLYIDKSPMYYPHPYPTQSNALLLVLLINLGMNLNFCRSQQPIIRSKILACLRFENWIRFTFFANFIAEIICLKRALIFHVQYTIFSHAVQVIHLISCLFFKCLIFTLLLLEVFIFKFIVFLKDYKL